MLRYFLLIGSLAVAAVSNADSEVRVISNRSISNATVEVTIDALPLDDALVKIYEEAGLRRELIIVWRGEDASSKPHVSIRFYGKVRDLDKAIDRMITSTGYRRTRGLDGIDTILPFSKAPAPAAPPRTDRGVVSTGEGSGDGR